MSDHFLVIDWNHDMSEMIGVFDTLDLAVAATARWRALPRQSDLRDTYGPAIELWDGEGYTRSWGWENGQYVEMDLR